MAEYVIILDRDLDHCRLFRADCPDAPSGEILWSGNGLRTGYDEMIRLNRNRRQVRSYHVCERPGAKGRPAYRVFSAVPPEGGWTERSVHYSWAEARSEASRLAGERDAAIQAEKERMLALMRRVGISGRRIPRLTERDIRYVGWLRETGRFDGDIPQAAVPGASAA